MNRYSDDEFEEIEEDIQEETEHEDREAEEEEDEDEDNLLIHMAATLREREQDEEDQRRLQAEQELNDDPDFTENELNNMEMDTDIDLPSFDEIYDVFRIHTSNTQLFNNINFDYQFDGRLRGLGGLRGIENTSNVGRDIFTGTQDMGDDVDLMCPVCHEFIDGIAEFASHLVYEHSRFFVSYTGTMYQNSTAEDIMNVMSLVRPPSSYSDITRMNIENRTGSNSNMRELIQRLIFNEDEDEDGDNAPSYEELLRLCEYIGYHKQGIHNVDKVSTKYLVAEDETINQDDTCIICIEPLYTKESIRKINKCSHKFCSDCIETWFEENKVCPLCKTDVDTDNTHIQNNENSDSVNI